MFELYQTGQANNGELKCNDEIKKAVPNGSRIDGVPIVDWILIHSLRFSENSINWGKYDPHVKKTWNAMTLTNEFPDLLNRLNVNVSIESSGSLGDLDWAKTELTEWLTTKAIVIFINSKAYKNDDPSEDWYERWIEENYGRHFVVMHNFTLNSNGSVIVNYWDYGDRSKTALFESYDKFIEATFKYWVIKNEGTD